MERWFLSLLLEVALGDLFQCILMFFPVNVQL